MSQEIPMNCEEEWAQEFYLPENEGFLRTEAVRRTEESQKDLVRIPLKK